MITFGPDGILSKAFASGRGHRIGVKQFRDITEYPDSSNTLQRYGLRPKSCLRCRRTYVAGTGFEAVCRPCSEADEG